MKIKNIKNKVEFWEFADIWYQRSHQLREIWQNDSEPTERREKALKLWLVMYRRVMKVSRFGLTLMQAPMPKNYKPGGIIAPKRT